jgi:putative endopeptidase
LLKLTVLAAALVAAQLAAQAADTAPSTAPAASSPAVGSDRAAFDTSVRPQDDLFRAANGNWLKDTPIPPDKSSYGLFHILADRSDERIRAIVDELAAARSPEGSVEQKIGRFYRSFTALEAIDAAGTAPLKPDLARIAALRDKTALAGLMGEWQGRLPLPLELGVQPDAKQPDRYLTLTWQSGLGLPNRDYYLSTDAAKVKARAAYRDYLEALFRLNGESRPADIAAEVLALETRLARGQWDEVDNRDALKTWHPMAVKALAKTAPGLDWRAYFDAAAMPGMARVNVSQPSYAQAFARTVADTPLATWKRYLQARQLDASANLLPKDWRDAWFAFHGKALGGQAEPRPRWQQAIRALDGALGEALGQVYVARHFPAANKARMKQLVDDLMVAYDRSIAEADWLTPATRTKAREKLAKYTVKIGYPSRWRDYSRLEIREGDPLGNVLRAGRFEFERTAAHLGQPVDREEWGMTPQTVNAYYDPSKNEIVFPAAILEPPFFDMKADDAENYGAIGAVIGHEISHGFDDQGSRYDGDGRLRDWWTAQDRKAFSALGERLVKQYGAYEPLAGHKVNGQLTLGENIADLSGLQIAYKAWKLSLKGKPAPVIGGMSGEQRFFYAFATAWRGKARDEAALRYLTMDPHSPDEFRANGTVVNHDGFHAAFGTQPKDRMYKSPAERIRIW